MGAPKVRKTRFAAYSWQQENDGFFCIFLHFLLNISYLYICICLISVFCPLFEVSVIRRFILFPVLLFGFFYYFNYDSHQE